jgi:hypothetical protein
MLFDIPAQVQKFVRNRAQLYADTVIGVCLLELLDKMRVLHKCKAVANTLRLERYSVIEIGIVGITRPSSVE